MITIFTRNVHTIHAGHRVQQVLRQQATGQWTSAGRSSPVCKVLILDGHFVCTAPRRDGPTLFARTSQLVPRSQKCYNKPSLLDTLPASVLSAQIKSLGMITDCFDSHIGAAVMVCNYHTRALRYVRKHLTTETAQTIACSVISSQVDYCNSLLYGAPVAVIEKLQRAQNNVAQVICQQRY